MKKKFNIEFDLDELLILENTLEKIRGYSIAKGNFNEKAHLNHEEELFNRTLSILDNFLNKLSIKKIHVIKSLPEQKELSQNLANEISKAIINNKEEHVNLLTCIVNAIQKYHIIGKEQEDDSLPF